MEFADFFKFDKFLAPVLIKIAYWIGLAIIVVGTISGMLGMSLMSRFSGGGDSSAGGIILALILGVLWTLIWRILCEAWIVIFSINDRLGVIAHQSQPKP